MRGMQKKHWMHGGRSVARRVPLLPCFCRAETACTAAKSEESGRVRENGPQAPDLRTTARHEHGHVGIIEQVATSLPRQREVLDALRTAVPRHLQHLPEEVVLRLAAFQGLPKKERVAVARSVRAQGLSRREALGGWTVVRAAGGRRIDDLRLRDDDIDHLEVLLQPVADEAAARVDELPQPQVGRLSHMGEARVASRSRRAREDRFRR